MRAEIWPKHRRAKKTLFGLGLTATGLSSMAVSPFAGKAVGLSDVLNLGSFYVMYLAGFVVLLFGVGFLLIANNLWGELQR
jgi:hypothetical protein